ncbi:MAG: FxDxF family PEP-CTERM protein [Azoarcus sp.]|jgi:hypothetical protein|nr:FxDxF family PEP-CTERM protein [Azoarcus sp.]
MKHLSKLAAALVMGLGLVGAAQAGSTRLTDEYGFGTDSTWSSSSNPTDFYFDQAFQYDFHFQLGSNNPSDTTYSLISLDLAAVGVSDWSVSLTDTKGNVIASFDKPTGTFDLATLEVPSFSSFPYTLSVTGTPISNFGQQSYFDITIKSATVPGVPEPETYAMLLAGLGLVGTMARRRMKA